MTTTVAKAGTYLSFKVGEESYGLDILGVQEVVGLTEITRVPQMSDAVRGVINLRGRVIPVFDLRVKFGILAADTEVTCIIIGQVASDDHQVTVGFIADEIRGVIHISSSEMGPVPEFGKGRSAPFLTGMATTESGVVMTLDIDNVMDGDDISMAESAV